jgi:hypothetical protein
MRHRHLSRTVLALCCCLLATAGALDAQATRPVCTLSPSSLRDVRLKDGNYGILFPGEMSVRGDTVLVLGTSGVFDARGERVRVSGGDSATVGFLLTDGQRTAAPVPAPAGLPTARYFRVRPSEYGWEAVFFVPDRDTIPGTPLFDDGTLWYGRLRGGRWNAVERIDRVRHTMTVRPNSAGLTQSGPLSFAVVFGDPIGPGGVIVWQRVGEGKWKADTVPLRFTPGTVTAIGNAARGSDAWFFPVASIWGEETINVGSLLSVPATKPSSSSIVRLNPAESMNEPVIYWMKDTLQVSWWEFERGGPPNLWYQPLDPERGNSPEARRRVASGISEFVFLAVPEGARTRLVWAYRPPDARDSAEVAVVANGEPKVIGRVAFPFGFMTSGVASGDRSFILATSPRPVPDGEPSASRTLEVRVNCTGGT